MKSVKNLNSQELMKSVIQRIATGPELSKNISRDEAKQAMRAILRGEVSEVRLLFSNCTKDEERNR